MALPMKTTLALLCTVVTFCASHGTQTNLACPLGTVCSLQLGYPQCIPLTNHMSTVNALYSDPLISLANGQSGLSASVGTNVDTSYNEPLITLNNGQTVAAGDLSTAVKTTVPISAVDPGYNIPFLPVTNGYSGLMRYLALARLRNRPRSLMLNYGSNLGQGLTNCGFLPPECRATRQHLNTAPKYTFDYTLNKCVQISVCSTCALLNGRRVNLFDNQFECNRCCHR